VNPRARRAELVVRDVADETLVYDLKRHRAHCLNRAAALVWRACDGRTPVTTIGRMLERQTGAEGGVEAAWLALAQLRKAGLLDETSLPERPAPGISRRRALGRMAATALLVPAVISVTAPTAGAAGSGGGQACRKNSDCGPGGACLFGRCV